MLTQSAHSPALSLRGSEPDEETAASFHDSAFVGQSAEVKRIRLQVQRIAPHFRYVLISGERGTGKELVARMLHEARGRAGEPFLPRDAAAVEGCKNSEESLVRFVEGARQGTLFLDSVEKITLPAQDWLLRMLGWEANRPALRRNPPRTEMRLVASTTEDLRTLVAAGRFRQELHRRLSTVEIAVPPLRERTEDIPELARHFLDRFRQMFGKGISRITPEAIRQLREHHWPGNIREMSDVIRDGVLQSNGESLGTEHLTALADRRDGEGPADAEASVRLHDVVERHVLGVLTACGGNKLRAAEMLGISRSTLYRMLDSGNSAGALR